MVAVKKYEKVSRWLELIYYLESRRGITIQDLAARFSLPETEVLQELQDLNSWGVPVYFSTDGCRILSPLPMAAHYFSPEERLLLSLSLTHLAESGGIESDSYQRLRDKLAFPEGEAGLEPLEMLQATFKHGPSIRNVVNPLILSFFNRALVEKKRIRMKYRSRSSGEPAWRELSPYTTLFRKDTWYGIGYCHKRNEIRTFKIARIEEVDFSDAPYQDDAEFDIDTYLMYSWNIMGGETEIVVVRFDKEVGPLILEKQITHGKIWKEKGFVYMQTVISGLEEFSWWIMQYGEHAEVMQPKELRKILLHRCTKMAAKYQETVTRRSRKVKSSKLVYL